MNKNTVVAIALSALVLLVFQMFFAPKPAVQNKTQATEQKAVTDTAANDSTPTVVLEDKETKAPLELHTFDVSSDFVKYTFNQDTGNLTEADINNYNGRVLKGKLFKSVSGDVFFADVPTISAYTSEVSKTGGKTSVVFSGSAGDLVVTKKYTVDDKSFLVNAEVVISNTGDKTISVPFKSGVGPGATNAFEADRYAFQGPVMFDGKRLKKEKETKAEKPLTAEKVRWVGYMSKYYMIGVASDFVSGTISKKGASAVVEGQSDLKLNPGDRITVPLSVYAGPKEYELLKSFGKKFEKSIDFGIFAFIAIPMLKFLNIIYDFVGNYGVAIILLTIVVKLVTFPLTQKSMVSMRKMSSLQPKMQELKEKYKNDKERINQATMELYKKEGVNPLGGCLPMLLQIPIFFALYRTLLLSIELQGAPFAFWITDLSLKDPYYITPVIMGVTMFLQQRMTPSTATDPMQKKLFTFMPVIFTFLFLTFPAGLVVYWLTNNILSIAQQYVINKKFA